ncbi:hypothetical protein O2K51_01090 [Apibacter raozihei]|uniref:hypothetical protein n=1 Tax=Apibacter raozihei TaxID=2500547 RepID=UPI000FE3AE2D|nr:hypothetical protein [Apibacter raozihei]
MQFIIKDITTEKLIENSQQKPVNFGDGFRKKHLMSGIASIEIPDGSDTNRDLKERANKLRDFTYENSWSILLETELINVLNSKVYTLYEYQYNGGRGFDIYIDIKVYLYKHSGYPNNIHKKIDVEYRNLSLSGYIKSEVILITHFNG